MNSKLYKTYRQLCLLFFVSFMGAAHADAQIINTVAGIGTAGYSGDGGAATSAQIWWPINIASDAAGGFYTGGDWWWSGSGSYARIRRVNAAGIIYTYAGNGSTGFSGDGGPATAAQIWGGGVATDAAGNLYIMDWGNARIRKVNTSGIITTIAGNGATGAPTGDGGPATAAALGIWSSSGWWGANLASDPSGNLYFYLWGYNIVRRIDASTGIITLYAGTGTYGYSGDGGPATSANIGQFYGITADGSGNVFFSDWNYKRVRKVNSSGIISTYAGTGTAGFSGDGGPATSANINTLGIAVDGGGNLYLADYNNNRVRRVDATGTISTIAGNGTYSFSGDGGPATAASFRYPYGIATEASGNVYVGDYLNVRVRKITIFNRPPVFTAGASTTLTVCQNSPGDSVNAQLAIRDSDMFQYAAWSLLTIPSHGVANIIYGRLTTGGVISPMTCLYKPTAGYVGLDTFQARVFDGYTFDTITVYVTVNPMPGSITGITAFSSTGYTLLSATPPGGTWSSSSGTIAATSGSTGIVTGVGAGIATITYTLPTGCFQTTTVNVFASAGQTITTVAGNGTSGYLADGVAATSTRINQPYGVAVDASGNFYIADTWNHRVRKVNSSGIISTIAGTGTSGFSGDGGAATAAALSGPTGVTLDNSGNIYIADQQNNRVRKISTTGVISTVAGNGTGGFSGDGAAATAAALNFPTGVLVDGSGNIFIADYFNNRVRKVSTSGIISTIAGTGASTYGGDGGAATLAQIYYPTHLASDMAGNLYIADYYNHRIRKVNTSGIISTVAGNGLTGSSGDGAAATAARLTYPYGVSVDILGNVFIGDASNHRIRKVNLSGIINTLAGTGTGGFSGDNCAASAAQLNNPAGVAVDITGAVYFADRSNHRIRKIYDNHAPVFTGGHKQTSSMCQSSVDTINLLSEVLDVDVNQTLTWSVATGALHGTVTASHTATSTGSAITPTGLYYTPTIGYTGVDSFRLLVTDCSGGLDTTWIVVTINPPPSGIAGVPAICAGLTTTYVIPGTGTWSSSSPSIASVGSSTGVVTGVSAGVATITFAPGASCFVTRTISVNLSPAPVSGPDNICMGTPATYTCATAGGAWSASGPISITGAGTTGTVSGTSAGTATVTYMHSGCPSMKAVTVNIVPSSIIVGGGISNSLCLNSTLPLSLTTSTPGGSWTSSTPAIGSVDASTGLLTGLAVGTTTVSYTMPSGCYSKLLVSVEPLPAAIVGPAIICVGQSTTMTNPTPGGVWSSFSIGSVVTSDSISGVVAGVATGTATISYTLLSGAGCSVDMTVTVDAPPTAIVGASSVCIGQTTTLTNAVAGGVWTSSHTARATVGSSSGMVAGVATGLATITYTLPSGCYVTKTMSVTAGTTPITGTRTVCNGLTTLLSCTPSGGTWSSATTSVAMIGSSGVVLGMSPGTSVISYTTPSGCASTAIVTVNSTPGTITGTLNACPSGIRTLTTSVPGGTWSSGTPSIATIGSLGNVSAVTPGTTTITYSIGSGCSSTAVFTVNPLPNIITGATSVCQGSTVTLSNTSTGGTWSASGGASVGATSGVVTGVTAGVAGITYTLPTGCARNTSITINNLPAPISGSSTVCQGQTIALASTTPGGTWGSSATSVATVGSTGVVSGVAAGTATITYSLSTGCLQTKAITVNGLPAAIVGAGSVCEGNNITLTHSSGGGTWSTASSAATVGSSSGTVNGVSGGVALISYTLGTTGCSATKSVTVNALPVITGPTALCVGATITQSSTPGGSWTSTVPSVATIGASSGVVSGIATGTTVISYTSPTGCQNTTQVTVSTSPGAISGAANVCVGLSTTLTNTVPGGAWSSSSGVATVGSLSGVVTGVAPGTTTITYSLGTGCTVTKTMTVLASPLPITGTGNLCVGGTSLLTSVTTSGTWSSSASTTAGVSGSGLVSGVAAGTATISYTVGSCSAILPVTVNITPGTISGPTQVCIGSSITLTNPISGGLWSTTATQVTIDGTTGTVNGISSGTALITYAIGACRATRTVSVNGVSAISGATGICVGANTTLTSPGGGAWSSSTPGVATIGASSGTVSGIAPGTTTITYTLGTGCSATTTVTVNTAPGVITGTLKICTGQTTTLNNATGGGIWSSSSPLIASAGSLSGIITGNGPGTATITYSLGSGCTATAVVTVNTSPGAIGGPVQTCMGSPLTLSNPTPGGTWSATGGTATITPGGVVSGTSAGTATVSYTLSSGCAATKEVTINAAAAAITGTANICVALTTALSNPMGGGTWSSGSTGIATVDASGMVTGVAPGMAAITYTLGSGCAATRTVTVNAAPGAITGSPQLCIGSTITLSNSTPGGTWTSGGTGIATVSGTGVVSGIAIGTEEISYTVGGCPAVTTVTVNGLPPAVTGPGEVCVGSDITLANATAGGTWSSSNPIVALAGSATGIVSGMNAGTATITYTLGAGCTVWKPVTVNPLPSGIRGSANICLGGTTTLVSPASGGIWSSGATSVAVIGSSSGVVYGLAGGLSVMSYTLPTTGCSAIFGLTVVEVGPTEGITGLCAWGDTMLVHNATTGGSFSSTLATVADLGGGYGIVTGHASGTATVTYTLAGLGCMRVTPITVNPLPGPITGGDRVCPGQTLALGNSMPGGVWGSSDATVAPITTGGALSGLIPGTTLVTYILPTGCLVDTVITVSLPPSAIAGTPQVCAGSTTTYTNTIAGGTWTSSAPLIAMIGAGTGVVSGVNPGTATITYTIAAGCSVTKTVVVNPLPAVYTVTGGGNYCAGGTGMSIGLSGSQNGTDYQLYLGATTAGTPVTGTGMPVDFGPQTATGSYTAIATNPLTGCTKAMTGSTAIGTIPTVVPSVTMNSSVGNPVCIGTLGTYTAIPVNGGSAPMYQWYVNGVPVGTGVSYDHTPNNGDVIRVELTSSAVCATPPVVSTQVTMTVYNWFVPVVTITAQPGTTIKAGQWDTLVANVTNGSSSQSYQWYWNGWPVSGVYTNTYVNKNFSNGDSVRCVVTSTGMCGGFTGQASTIITVLPGGGVGVNTVTGASNVQVLPNPNKGAFTIKGTMSGMTEEEVSIEVTNMLGQVIYRQNAMTRNGKLDENVTLGNNIASGMYLLNLRSGSDTKVFHIVVEQ